MKPLPFGTFKSCGSLIAGVLCNKQASYGMPVTGGRVYFCTACAQTFCNGFYWQERNVA